MEKISTDIITGVVSNGIIVFLIWAVTISLKSFIGKTVSESTTKLTAKIDSITDGLAEIETENNKMKDKMIVLKADLDKLEKQMKQLSSKINQLNCLRSVRCESVN